MKNIKNILFLFAYTMCSDGAIANPVVSAFLTPKEIIALGQSSTKQNATLQAIDTLYKKLLGLPAENIDVNLQKALENNDYGHFLEEKLVRDIENLCMIKPHLAIAFLKRHKPYLQYLEQGVTIDEIRESIRNIDRLKKVLVENERNFCY